MPLFRANASELQLGKLPAGKSNTLIQISVLEPEPNDCTFRPSNRIRRRACYFPLSGRPASRPPRTPVPSLPLRRLAYSRREVRDPVGISGGVKKIQTISHCNHWRVGLDSNQERDRYSAALYGGIRVKSVCPYALRAKADSAKIAMSATSGTNRTCRRGLLMLVVRGRPEVTGRGANRRV